MVYQDNNFPDVLGNVERDRYRNSRIDAKLEEILDLSRAAMIRHNHFLQELQELQENQDRLSEEFESVKDIVRHNHCHSGHADRRKFLDRDRLNDEDKPRKVCNIPRYDGDHDNLDVNSEDSSSKELPGKKRPREKPQKPAHNHADDDVQVVSVTVATEKNLPMLTC